MLRKDEATCPFLGYIGIINPIICYLHLLGGGLMIMELHLESDWSNAFIM
jgi:hypothetical protein